MCLIHQVSELLLLVEAVLLFFFWLSGPFFRGSALAFGSSHAGPGLLNCDGFFDLFVDVFDVHFPDFDFIHEFLKVDRYVFAIVVDLIDDPLMHLLVSN